MFNLPLEDVVVGALVAGAVFAVLVLLSPRHRHKGKIRSMTHVEHRAQNWRADERRRADERARSSSIWGD